MEDEIRRRLREALSVEDPDPALRSRVVSSMPIEPDGPRPRWQYAAGAIAVVLILAIVASLTYFGRLANHPSAALGPVGSVAITTQLDFKCNLPVAGNTSYAFVSLPDGKFSIDNSIPQQPGGKPLGQYTYDPALTRWVPVQPQWLSPDGRSYAYVSSVTGVPGQVPSSSLHVKDIAGGKDRTIWSGDGMSQMLGYTASGIYFTYGPYGYSPIGGGPDIYAIDPNGGAPRKVGPSSIPASGAAPYAGPGTTFFQVSGAGAWGVGFTSFPTPQQVPPSPGALVKKPSGPDKIMRMDLRDGSVSTWYTAPEGNAVGILGFDSQSHPIASVTALPTNYGPGGYFPGAPKILILTAPDQSVEIASGADASFRPSLASTDSHGIWFGAPGSIWLYSRGGGLKKVAELRDNLFPPLSPPPGFSPPPTSGNLPSPPSGFPTGVFVRVAGPCT